MNKKILDILEFDKVKQLFEPYLQTEQGEMELAVLTPTDKKESIETAFMELEDMEQILLEDSRFAVSTIQDVRPVTKRLEMEAALFTKTWKMSVWKGSIASLTTWWICPAYKEGYKLSTKEALSSLLPVKNWLKSVAASRKMNTRSERFCKTC